MDDTHNKTPVHKATDEKVKKNKNKKKTKKSRKK